MLSQGSIKKEANLKMDQDYSDKVNKGMVEDFGEEIPDHPKAKGGYKDADDNSQGDCKATDRFAKAIIKVFGLDKQKVMAFPMLVRNFIGDRGYFYALRNINLIISDMINGELERKGFVLYFISLLSTSYGFGIDSRIASNDKLIADEFYLNNHNYQDHFFSAYIYSKTIILHVHTNENIMKPIKHGQDQA